MDVLDRPFGRGYEVILSPRDLHLPLDIAAMARGRRFERVELEIGFGNGEYTAHYAKAHPEVLLFGVELSPVCLMRCAQRAVREGGLSNLRLILADGGLMTRELFPDESLDRVVMNFPCPWPKLRHANRRVTARGFADGLAAVLKVGGAFELLTDDAPYAEEAESRLGPHPALESRAREVNPLRPVTTKYERRWMAEGKDIYRLTFTKVRAFTASRRTWQSDEQVQEGLTVHIRTAYPITEAAIAALNGVSGGADGAQWAFARHYIAPISDGGAFLLETFSQDEGFEQRYYIRISQRDGGGLLQLDRTANAFLTPAVRGALKDAAERLSVQEA